ncbi:MAG: hypothetical protein LBN23_06625 [Paludibacter sp.]|nr:hypothetical protein [Paludibacter sp.]
MFRRWLCLVGTYLNRFYLLQKKRQSHFNLNGVKMTAGGVNNYYLGSKYEVINSKEILYLCGDA